MKLQILLTILNLLNVNSFYFSKVNILKGVTYFEVSVDMSDIKVKYSSNGWVTEDNETISVPDIDNNVFMYLLTYIFIEFFIRAQCKK